MAKTPKQIKTLKDLTPDPQNVNKGTQRGLSALDHSARKFGVGRGVVVDRNGVIIAGNKTVECLADLGITKIKPVHTSGDELVVTVRDDLDLLSKKDRRARGLALADNRVGELDYDPDAEALAMLAKDERELLEGLWNDKEIANILGEEQGQPNGESYKEQWLILVECGGEQEQLQLIERFQSEGLKVRALVS